jgi:hypothetical protein
MVDVTHRFAQHQSSNMCLALDGVRKIISKLVDDIVVVVLRGSGVLDVAKN